MMPQSIDKKKIYFYLLIFLFLSTIFNFNSVSKFNNLKLIKNIEVKGLNGKEENQLINSLKIFKDKNIFLIKKSEILNSLSVFNFLDDISIQKVLPSKLIILTEKTIFLGITILDGKKFYIGKNGKLTPIFQVKKEQNLPLVFGNLKINEFLNLQKVLIKENIELNKIKKYFYYKNKRWDLQYDTDLIVKLPYKNVKSSLQTFRYLIENNKINNVKIVDLRIPNNIVLTDE